MTTRDSGSIQKFSGARPVVIGLTGAIASGKSAVAELLREQGAEVIDADRVYRSLVSPGSALHRGIVERFGPTVVQPNGELDRRQLGHIVFHDSEALHDLDRLTHPAVVSEVRRRITRSTAPVVVIEAVKLVQAGLLGDTDSLWLVVAAPEIRRQRLISRNGMSDEAAQSRISAASPPLPAGVMANVTIDNSDGLPATKLAVEEAWRRLLANHGANGA